MVREQPLPPFITQCPYRRSRRTPSPPASRRSPSRPIPFELPSSTPPSPSPPQSWSLSPAIPAPHRQPDLHQVQSEPSPPGTSAILNRLWPPPLTFTSPLLSLMKPPKHATFGVIFDNVALRSRGIALHPQQSTSNFENHLDDVDHMHRPTWPMH